MRYLLTLAAILFGLACITSSADARTRSATHQAHVEKRLVKKVDHVLTKAKTKVTKAKTERKVAHVKKRAKRKLTRVIKKGKRKGILPSASAVPMPDANPMRSADNVLVRAAMAHVGTNPTGWSHDWCGYYLAMALRQAGYTPGPNLARDYASYGRPAAAQVGAIAVMPHHVGVVASIGSGYVMLVSGNHGGKSGHRTVGLGRYPISRIMAFRMPV